jgi:hypothetical protein
MKKNHFHSEEGEGVSEWAVATSQGLFFLDINTRTFKHRLCQEETIELEARQIINLTWIESNKQRDLLLMNVRELFYY